MLKDIHIFAFFIGLLLCTHALAAEDPDELYKQGRFAEAEKAYAQSDMDHPKDIRYRYNRGCAAYQNSDYQGAEASFSSVLRRAKDNEVRFKTAYNLGNTAFNQGDLASALAYYKQAVLFNPESEDAKYNLELVLRELEKQKKHKTGGQETPPQKDSGQPETKGNKSKTNKKKEESSEKSSQEETSNQGSAEAQGERHEGSQIESNQEPQSEKGAARSDEGHKTLPGKPEDLSGDLKPLQDLPEEQEKDQTPDTVMSMIDKKKAEALLDNVKEDRSRFLQFQVTKDKRRGIQSGKDW